MAQLFGVSLGMVKKLLHQRKVLGDIEALHWRAGRKTIILLRHNKMLLHFLKKHPDATLEKLRVALGMDCSLTTIHHALARWGMTRKNRRAQKAIPTHKARENRRRDIARKAIGKNKTR
ncbi:MAG: hypothetical protein EOM72_05945 [Opitutae bacterium]|nr:hypothetical protein [Opitutae bacterium]